MTPELCQRLGDLASHVLAVAMKESSGSSCMNRKSLTCLLLSKQNVEVPEDNIEKPYRDGIIGFSYFIKRKREFIFKFISLFLMIVSYKTVHKD